MYGCVHKKYTTQPRAAAEKMDFDTKIKYTTININESSSYLTLYIIYIMYYTP